MAQVGEIASGKDIGLSKGRWIYATCPQCGKPRWRILRDYRKNPDGLCKSCFARVLGNRNQGRRFAERGKGRYINRGGYVEVRIRPNSLCFGMSHYKVPKFAKTPNGSAYVLEHRLVMAEYLGRPLSRLEHVHHINGNKLDNRIENLLLVSPASHTIRSELCANCELRKEIRLLKWQIKEQNEQIRNLTTALMGIGDSDANSR